MFFKSFNLSVYSGRSVTSLKCCGSGFHERCNLQIGIANYRCRRSTSVFFIEPFLYHAYVVQSLARCIVLSLVAPDFFGVQRLCLAVCECNRELMHVKKTNIQNGQYAQNFAKSPIFDKNRLRDKFFFFKN